MKETDHRKNYQKEVKNALQMLEAGVREMFESERYEEYIQALARFHNYSFNNALLIAMQRPDATAVASFTTYRKMKIHIKKGEKGIKILCPVPYTKQVHEVNGDGEEQIKVVPQMRFKIGYVFDIAQTDGKLPSIVEPPTENSDALRGAVDALICTDQISYDEALRNGGANGFYNLIDGSIHLKPDMSDLMTLRCLVHEKAHKHLHGQKDGLSRQTREIEAEATSAVVMACLGYYTKVRQYSDGYIAGWSREKSTKELLESAARIMEASKSLLNWITSSCSLTVMEGEIAA